MIRPVKKVIGSLVRGFNAWEKREPRYKPEHKKRENQNSKKRKKPPLEEGQGKKIDFDA
jgi:hypothetical protein